MFPRELTSWDFHSAQSAENWFSKLCFPPCLSAISNTRGGLNDMGWSKEVGNWLMQKYLRKDSAVTTFSHVFLKIFFGSEFLFSAFSFAVLLLCVLWIRKDATPQNPVVFKSPPRNHSGKRECLRRVYDLKTEIKNTVTFFLRILENKIVHQKSGSQ